ncbi:hypothetical protein HDV02_001397 [Globomyces sp. JEL0801]|nr:hypothetical protein HDV02_001397 [Globomyces sp. JEL0801]
MSIQTATVDQVNQFLIQKEIYDHCFLYITSNNGPKGKPWCKSCREAAPVVEPKLTSFNNSLTLKILVSHPGLEPDAALYQQEKLRSILNGQLAPVVPALYDMNSELFVNLLDQKLADNPIFTKDDFLSFSEVQ